MLVYDQGTLVFTGRFGAAGKRRLTDSELRIIAAIQFAVEELT